MAFSFTIPWEWMQQAFLRNPLPLFHGTGAVKPKKKIKILSKKKEALTLLILTFIYIVIYTKTQFLPHRQYTPWPLQRPIGSSWRGKSAFIVRILWSAYRYCVGKMQSFVTLQRVVRIITITLYKVKEVECVGWKSESASHSMPV